MTIISLDDLYTHSLRTLLYTGRKSLSALHRMERKATCANLKAAFLSYREEGEEHAARLEEVLQLLGEAARSTKCDAMIGLIKVADGLMANIDDADIMDAALISHAKAVKHLEIASYGTLVAWSKQLGYLHAAGILRTTLEEEYSAEKALSKLTEDRLGSVATA